MATSAAISATTNAIVNLLKRAAEDDPEWNQPGIDVLPIHAANLQDGLATASTSTLSVFLYRVALSAGLRNVPLRHVSGVLLRPAIPVDLFYLVTSWAQDPTMQQRLLGWAIRSIEDASVLPSTLLNEGSPTTVFAPNETVEIVWHLLTMQEEFDLWQVAQTNQQPSASYVARTVALESTLTVPAEDLVQVREFDYQLGTQT